MIEDMEEPDLEKLIADANKAVLEINAEGSVDVELDDADMEDPELLAEMRALGWEESSAEQVEDATDEKELLAMRAETSDKLRGMAREWKVKAVRSKKAGDMPGARRNLIFAKTIEKTQALIDKLEVGEIEEKIPLMLQELDEKMPSEVKIEQEPEQEPEKQVAKPPSPKGAKEVVPVVAQAAVKSEVKSDDIKETDVDTDKLKPDELPQTSPSPDSEKLEVEYATEEIVQERIKQYRITASNWNKKGDKKKALTFLRTSKKIQNDMLMKVQLGEKVLLSDLPPNPLLPAPASTSQAAGPPAKKAPSKRAPKKAKPPALSPEDLKTYQLLEKSFVEQVNICLSEAKANLEGNRAKAAEWVKEKKLNKEELDILREMKKRNRKPPQYRVYTKEYVPSRPPSNLPDDVIEMTLKTLKNENPPSGYSDLSVFLTCQCDMFGQFRTEPHKIKKGETRELNITKRFKFIRRERKVKFGKINFEINHKKWIGELFLGSSTVKMKDLLTSATANIKTPLRLDSRKPICTLTLELRISKPVLETKPETIKKKWYDITSLKGDKGTQEASVKLEEPTAPEPEPELELAKPSSSSRRSQRESRRASKRKSKIDLEKKMSERSERKVDTRESKKRQAAPKAAAPVLPAGIDESMVDFPFAVDYYVSQVTLEKEIAWSTNKVKANPRDEEESDRLEGLRIALQVLEAQAASQMITPESYAAKLREQIEFDGKLALALKRLNKIPEARRVLIRRNLMRKECEEAGL